MRATPEYRPKVSLLWGTAPPLTGSSLKCSAYLGVLCHAGPSRVRATAAVSRASILVGCVTHSAQRSVCLLFSRLRSNSWGRSLDDMPPSTPNDRLWDYACDGNTAIHKAFSQRFHRIFSLQGCAARQFTILSIEVTTGQCRPGLQRLCIRAATTVASLMYVLILLWLLQRELVCSLVGHR